MGARSTAVPARVTGNPLGFGPGDSKFESWAGSSSACGRVLEKLGTRLGKSGQAQSASARGKHDSRAKPR